jgi:hypothetical protein
LFIEILQKDFKILAFDLPDLPTNTLRNVVIHCPDYKDVENNLSKYSASIITIACRSGKLVGLDILLAKYPNCTLYVLNDNENKELREWFDGLIFNNMIQVQNEKQLMRRVCTTTMLGYYNQAIGYQKDGNNSLANLCRLDSLAALDYSTHFI